MYFEAGGVFCVKKMYQPCGSLTSSLDEKECMGTEHHGLPMRNYKSISDFVFDKELTGMAVRSVCW